jgi:hypothetical protein
MHLFISEYKDVIRFSVSARNAPNIIGGSPLISSLSSSLCPQYLAQATRREAGYFLRIRNPIIPYWELSLSQAEDLLDLIIKQQEHKATNKKQIEDTFLTPAWIGYKLVRFGETRIEVEVDLQGMHNELYEAIFNAESYRSNNEPNATTEDALNEIIRDLGL